MMSRYRVPMFVLLAILLLGFSISLAGVSPLTAFSVIFKGSLGSLPALGGTLKEMTPLLLAGIAVYLGLKAGLFNIGVEGQFAVGALSCVAVVLALPNWGGVLLGVVVACLTGAVWAWPAGWIRAYRGGHEVITTIMLNGIAAIGTAYLVNGPLKAPSQSSATTAKIESGLHLPTILQSPKINLGLMIGIILVFGLAYWLKHRVAGYELRLTGDNPTAAEMAGVPTKRKMLSAMMLSGAIGGLAGAVYLLAFEGRFYADFSAGYGFTALGVALLAGNRPVSLILSAFIFGVLAKGESALGVEGIPKGFSSYIIGFVILLFAVIHYRKKGSYIG